MQITKDELRILASTLETGKYELAEMQPSRVDAKKLFAALELLQHRLEVAAIDRRRQGRTSQNSFSDLLKRYSTQ
jgi:hypothetical protein